MARLQQLRCRLALWRLFEEVRISRPHASGRATHHSASGEVSSFWLDMMS